MGISAPSIIADITGGTKPMTTALVLACLNGEPPLDLEHVPTRFEVNYHRLEGGGLDSE